MGLNTLDGSDDRCGFCRSEAVHAAGESFDEGGNVWFLERLCTSCGESAVLTGRGFVPDPERRLVLELTGRWRLRVDQGSSPDTGVAVLRFLRRVYDQPISGVRQLRAELVGNGLLGTKGEVAWLAAELADLGVAAQVALEVAGTQTELPERRMPAPPSRIDGGVGGSAAGAVGAVAVGAMAVAVEDAAERSRIAGYLGAAQCLVAGGYWVDPVTRDPRHRGGEAVMSDGVYAWSVAWSTLLGVHGLPLAPDFVAHVRGLGYVPPVLGADEIRAAQVALGLVAPEES